MNDIVDTKKSHKYYPYEIFSAERQGFELRGTLFVTTCQNIAGMSILFSIWRDVAFYVMDVSGNAWGLSLF